MRKMLTITGLNVACFMALGYLLPNGILHLTEFTRVQSALCGIPIGILVSVQFLRSRY